MVGVSYLDGHMLSIWFFILAGPSIQRVPIAPHSGKAVAAKTACMARASRSELENKTPQKSTDISRPLVLPGRLHKDCFK